MQLGSMLRAEGVKGNGERAKAAAVTVWDAPGPVSVDVWAGCSSPEWASSFTVIHTRPVNFDSSQPFMRWRMIWFGKWSGCIGDPTVNEEPLSRQLLRLKAKTSWSWERMCRELHRVMGEEGPSHTTLFRYASGRVKRPNVVTEQYVRKAIQKVTAELSQK